MPPDPSLGRMMSEAQSYIFSNPGFAIFPGVILILIILGISLIGSYLE
jgi:peptide/nickel transport system permease protein